MAKAQEYQDSCDRNEVEGVFGTGKTAYGLGRIAAHLKATAFCTIGVALILMNPPKVLLSDEYRELWNAVLYGIGTGSNEIVAVALSHQATSAVRGATHWDITRFMGTECYVINPFSPI